MPFKISLYSKHWKKYFCNLKDENVFYFDSDSRMNLTKILDYLNYTKKTNIFKFTGPTGTGKSFFLFTYSKTNKNSVYLNIKVLSSIKNEVQLKNMLIDEFKYLEIPKDKIDDINLIFKDNCGLEIIIKKIIFFIIDNKIYYKGKKFLLILDQFKYKYFSENMIKEIEEKLLNTYDSNIKIIICSSIDDSFVRKNVINLWEALIPEYFENKEEFDYLQITQNYFHYIPYLLELNKVFDNNYFIPNNLVKLDLFYLFFIYSGSHLFSIIFSI
jgi:hypothetical protein